MFSITSQVADTIYAWSNILLVLGAILALTGTLGVFLSGGVREKFADERISANEAETAKAKAETAQAQLEQQRLRAQMSWRELTPYQHTMIVKALSAVPFHIELGWRIDDPEATHFAGQLRDAFTAAKCRVTTLQIHMGSGSYGVWTEKKNTPEAERLRTALRTAAVLFSTDIDSTDPLPIRITIAERPPLRNASPQ